MRIELINPEQILLEEVNDQRLHQRDVAATYALAMSTPGVDWKRVNKAIIERWSLAGLQRVKTMAWKLREG